MQNIFRTLQKKESQSRTNIGITHQKNKRAVAIRDQKIKKQENNIIPIILIKK